MPMGLSSPKHTANPTSPTALVTRRNSISARATRASRCGRPPWARWGWPFVGINGSQRRHEPWPSWVRTLFSILPPLEPNPKIQPSTRPITGKEPCKGMRQQTWFLSWPATALGQKSCSKKTVLQRSNASPFTDDPSSRTRRVPKWQKQPWRTAIRFPSLPPRSIPRKIVPPVWPGGSSGIVDQNSTRYCLPRTVTVETRRCKRAWQFFQKGRIDENKCRIKCRII
mmetsp:Transcript_852/g.1738  ORF Transcript_852/g.1738 Transcript_852/m.1738 type:complete len:226 (-) Transcript_852:1902-2579(-)